MRFIIPAAVLMLFAVQAQAQTTTAPATAPAATTAPATTAPAASTPAPKKHGQTLQQRFDAANTSHDGHLTKDQATAAKWGYVTGHFSSMDKDHKGYVTVDDIRGYAKARRAAKKAPAAAPAPASNG